MKKVLLSILLTILPILAIAVTIERNGILYNLVPKINEAEVIRNPNIEYVQASYSGDIEIPASVTYNDVIYSVTSIGESVFYCCSNITSVSIPNSVTSIGKSAFLGCSGLTSIVIPNSVESIGQSAFMGCGGLTSITIPNSVTSIGQSAFSDCSGLTSITIPNSVTSIGRSAFSDCSGLTSITIPNSINSISKLTFRDCTGLISVIIPNSVESIGESAFTHCSGLTSVSIPNSVTTIENYAFSHCYGLTSVFIPNGVTTIGEEAFYGCIELTDVYCMAEKVKSNTWTSEGLYTNPSAFNYSYPQTMTLHVPAASIEDYRAMAPWSQFKAVVPLEGDDMKCATPEISYENGRVKFNCATEGVVYISSVTLADEHSYYDNEIQLSQKYKVSVYATKTGYGNSETATREIEIKGDNKPIVVGDVDGDGKVNVSDHVKLSEIIMNK